MLATHKVEVITNVGFSYWSSRETYGLFLAFTLRVRIANLQSKLYVANMF